jgi:hypothetical protein
MRSRRRVHPTCGKPAPSKGGVIQRCLTGRAQLVQLQPTLPSAQPQRRVPAPAPIPAPKLFPFLPFHPLHRKNYSVPRHHRVQQWFFGQMKWVSNRRRAAGAGTSGVQPGRSGGGDCAERSRAGGGVHAFASAVFCRWPAGQPRICARDLPHVPGRVRPKRRNGARRMRGVCVPCGICA